MSVQPLLHGSVTAVWTFEIRRPTADRHDGRPPTSRPDPARPSCRHHRVHPRCPARAECVERPGVEWVVSDDPRLRTRVGEHAGCSYSRWRRCSRRSSPPATRRGPHLAVDPHLADRIGEVPVRVRLAATTRRRASGGFRPCSAGPTRARWRWPAASSPPSPRPSGGSSSPCSRGPGLGAHHGPPVRSAGHRRDSRSRSTGTTRA